MSLVGLVLYVYVDIYSNVTEQNKLDNPSLNIYYNLL